MSCSELSNSLTGSVETEKDDFGRREENSNIEKGQGQYLVPPALKKITHHLNLIYSKTVINRIDTLTVVTIKL